MLLKYTRKGLALPDIKIFAYVKLTFAAAIGIELICISFAELGENIDLYVYGFTPACIAIAYALGYALAGVATFLTILGRSREGWHARTPAVQCSKTQEERDSGKIFWGRSTP